MTELFTVNVENTYNPPGKPPEEPPETPPTEGGENPPKEVEESPKETPDEPPKTPEESPKIPRNPMEAPKTGVNGNGIYVFIIVAGFLGLYLIRNKKKKNN